MSHVAWSFDPATLAWNMVLEGKILARRLLKSNNIDRFTKKLKTVTRISK